MARWTYTKEHIEYVRNIADNRFNAEIAEMFNEKFSTNKTASQISSMKKKNDIKSGDVRKRFTPQNFLLTEEQGEFIQKNVVGKTNKELTELLNKNFGLNLKVGQIATWKKNRKLSSGLTGRFEKGQETWNKGMKGLQLGGEKGWFKKGGIPHNHLPVGTERVNGDDYVDIKVAEPNVWEAKHRLVWKEANGEIPEGHVVMFGDGGNRNFNLSNLILASRAQLSVLNRMDLIQNDADLTRMGIVVADIHRKIGELKKAEDQSG